MYRDGDRSTARAIAASVEVGGGPPTLGPKDKQAFGNALDSYLARHASQ